jgi:hypothetical protein
MGAVHTSETSVNFDVTTLHYIPEDSILHTSRHENLKCHLIQSCSYLQQLQSYGNFRMYMENSVSHMNLLLCSVWFIL